MPAGPGPPPAQLLGWGALSGLEPGGCSCAAAPCGNAPLVVLRGYGAADVGIDPTVWQLVAARLAAP